MPEDTKLSDRLKNLVRVASDGEVVSLTVMLKPGASQQVVTESLERVRVLGGSKVAFIPITGTVHCDLQASQASALCEMNAVEHVDLESRAPIEELTDD